MAITIQEARVKGTGIRAMLKFAEKRGGPAALERVIARLPEADRKIVAAGILPSSRFSEEFDHRIILAICDEVFKGDYEQATAIGVAVLDEGMNIFSKLFLKMGDPAFLISKAGTLWNQYHEIGRLEVFDVQPKSARAKLLDYPLLDVAFCRCLSGSMMRALEVSGCKGMKLVHEQCVGKGHPHCQYKMSWD